jgi:hypothetical protein
MEKYEFSKKQETNKKEKTESIKKISKNNAGNNMPS